MPGKSAVSDNGIIEALEIFKNHSVFKTLGHIQRTHLLARELLEDMQNGLRISYIKYDSFANSVESLRLEMSVLKRVLEGLLKEPSS